jgi:hypothetical protein
MPKNISQDTALHIALDFLKKRKNTEKIDVLSVEPEREVWIITGACPINLEGHPWAEKYEVIVDNKGRIKSMHCSLL